MAVTVWRQITEPYACFREREHKVIAVVEKDNDVAKSLFSSVMIVLLPEA